MTRQLNYLVKIEGNEPILEKFIDAIEKNTCKIDNDYPNPYLLDTGEKFLNSSVITYFFQTRVFDKTLYINFFEKLRKLEPDGFKGYSYDLQQQIENLVCEKFDRVQKGEYRIFVSPSPQTIEIPTLSFEEKEILSFLCYVAVCHIKYGASFEEITAKEYFDVVTELGSNEVELLKKNGTGELAQELTAYTSSDLTCYANDVFATIEIHIFNDNEVSYKKALNFINRLLKADFPKSFTINFSSQSHALLPIKGLPECGQNYLFAGAIKYPDLHPAIKEYIYLAKRKWHWYSNLEAENCAMPSTFAALALGLEGEPYFDTIIDYLQTVDEEHQSLQENFTPVFLEKFGINARTIKVYISCIKSMQQHPHNPHFISYFNNEESLQLLLDSKINFASYYFTQEELHDFATHEYDVQEMAWCFWEKVMYTTFGVDIYKKNSGIDNITTTFTNNQKNLFMQLCSQ